MATILQGTPWPIWGHRGPIICRRRKVNMKLKNRNTAIMIAMNGDFSLQLTVASFSTDDNQVAPATTICNNFFKLIDTSASEGAALCSEGAQPAPTIVCNKLCGHGLIVDFVLTTSNLLLSPVLICSATSHLLLPRIHVCSAITMMNDPFQLILISVSKGACTAPITFNAKHFKLIFIHVKKFKTFLHFHEDCGMFCEGEWE